MHYRYQRHLKKFTLGIILFMHLLETRMFDLTPWLYIQDIIIICTLCTRFCIMGFCYVNTVYDFCTSTVYKKLHSTSCLLSTHKMNILHSAVQSYQYLTKTDRTLENQVNQDSLWATWRSSLHDIHTIITSDLYNYNVLGSLKQMGTKFWLSWVEILL